MLSEWEQWACAHHYITEHGEHAAITAGMRCDELLDACDYEGARHFQAIIRRINQPLEAAEGTLH